MREYIVFTNHEHYNDLGMVRSLGEVGINHYMNKDVMLKLARKHE